MVLLDNLARIAEIEFSDIVDATEIMETKLRIMLLDGGFVDVWLSEKLANRFGSYWEHKVTDLSYRYDNFPNAKWSNVSTFPYHFHDGSQDNVVDSSRFARDIVEGFRDFVNWVRVMLREEKK